MSLNVAIIGPGRSRQGTGPYIARAFHEQQARVAGVVSSSLESATRSATELKQDYGIDCGAYGTLHELLQRDPVDVVAICSPNASHREYLESAIEAGCHIFCEKPLWWPAPGVASELDAQRIVQETRHLVTRCQSRNVILRLNAQWPFTLPTYYELYPRQQRAGELPETFAMWLSPQRRDLTMIIDAAPHLLSMIYSLVGSGQLQNIVSNGQTLDSDKQLEIRFNYLHGAGELKVSLFLNPTDGLPKPAAYAINGRRADRHVELPNYLISLRSSDRQLPLIDPLVCAIKEFLAAVHSEVATDEVPLIDGMTHLAQIYHAVTTD